MPKVLLTSRHRVEKRIKGLTEWLNREGRGAKKAQLHLEKNTTERIYWHYGYLVALRDMLRLIDRDHADLN